MAINGLLLLMRNADGVQLKIGFDVLTELMFLLHHENGLRTLVSLFWGLLQVWRLLNGGEKLIHGWVR